MSDQVQGMCRSNDCDRPSVWWAEQNRNQPRSGKRGPRPKVRQWDGEFCAEHLIRCIPLKLSEMGEHDHLIIKPVWEI